LRELGERNDIIKRIHRGLTEKGWERGVEGFCEQRGEDDPSHSRQGCEDLHVMLLRLPRSGLFRRNEPGGQGIELAMRLLELLVPPMNDASLCSRRFDPIGFADGRRGSRLGASLYRQASVHWSDRRRQ
jgi:hypothetical protein